jgi:multiple sugar transport system permease protein
VRSGANDGAPDPRDEVRAGGRAADDEVRAARALVAPALVVLGLVTAYPVAMALWLATRRKILVLGVDEPVGLANVAHLLTDDRFWGALRNTTVFAGAAVTIEVLLGLGFAVLLDRKVPGEGLLRAAVLVPWALPTVVSARMWAWLFHPHHGLVGALLGGDLLATPRGAMVAAVVVDVWKTTPFVALLLLAGLKTIPGEVRRAAAIDGATGLTAFVRIDLPLLRGTLAVAILLRGLDALRVFDAIWVLTEGGPASSTETLSIYAYKTLLRAGDFGYGSTLSTATLFVVAALAAVWLRASRPGGLVR